MRILLPASFGVASMVPLHDDAKTPRMRQLETAYGMPIGDILVKLYKESSSWATVADVLELSPHTVESWRRMCCIKQVRQFTIAAI